MPSIHELNALVSGKRMFGIYQPAVQESIGEIADQQELRTYGFAHVANSVGYYFVTNAGLHYCEQERIGFLKKRFVARFRPKALIAKGIIDQITGPSDAYLRLYDDDKRMFAIWFSDETSEYTDRRAIDEAVQVARALDLSV